MSGTKEIGILKKEQKKTGETGGIAKLSGDAWRSLAANFIAMYLYIAMKFFL